MMKQIKGYEDYFIDELGEVFSKKSGELKKLKPWKNTKGYLQVQFSRDGRSKNLLVHKILAEAFISNPNNLPQINHKNGIKTDNRIENLEYCTNAYNTRHSVLNGLQKRKITIDQVEKMRDLVGKLTQRQIAKQFKISQQYVHSLIHKDRFILDLEGNKGII